MVWYVLLALGGMVVGYTLGSRRARAMKKRVVQQMNAQSLELLDAKSHSTQLESALKEQERAHEAVSMASVRLKQADKVIALLRQQQQVRDRKNQIKTTRLQALALENRQGALKATRIARKATLHLQRIEQASPVTQTIEAHEPKSYDNSMPVTVSVVDQARVDKDADNISKVSNRDSAILTKLLSSNEASAK